MQREPENLVDQLVEQIQKKIASGEYAPGQKLRQATLATAFQVSRTPVRQALSQLAARGLVDEDPASGVIVKPIPSCSSNEETACRWSPICASLVS